MGDVVTVIQCGVGTILLCGVGTVMQCEAVVVWGVF